MNVDKMTTERSIEMTNTDKLVQIIEESGLKKGFIASKLGLTTYGLQKKIENKTQFKAEEIKKMCIILNISSLKEKEEIFFAE